jgi:3-oxoacyl-[acyl-carrier protein] reductase
MDLGLRDRVYVVTGGSRGLGLAGARELVADGARVVLSARDEEGLSAAAESLGGPDHAIALPGDMSDTGLGERLAAAAVGRWGRLDGALVSVGGPPPAPALSLTDDQWRAAFDSVFLGSVRIARAVSSTIGEDGGALAFVLSLSVKQPVDGLASSNGLRPGLAMLAKTMADELGPRNIRVLGLLPGRVDTDRLRELDQASGRPKKQREEFEKRIPLGRYGLPEEFGRVAAFALSPAASYLNGVMIPVDGGLARAL